MVPYCDHLRILAGKTELPVIYLLDLFKGHHTKELRRLFENEHIIVWEQIGRPAEPIVHRHVLDILHFAVEPGTVEVSAPEGASGGSLAQ